MKKHLLIGLVLGFGISVTAQNQSNTLVKPSIASKSYPYSKGKAITGDGSTQATLNSSNSKVGDRAVGRSESGTVIGQTTYDLQSNSAVARRIINHGDGTLSAVWTIASDFSTYTTRGTGYQYFNGTAWFPVVTSRLENIRTGWPSIGLLGSGKEFILSHDAAVYRFQQGTNASKGVTAWTFSASGANGAIPPSTQGTIWGRVAVAGPGDSTIHVISNASDSLIIKNGVKSPFLYARSLNNGATWPIKDSTLPGYNNSRTKRSSADDYAIDAQNTNVAIVQGGLAEDVVLWKSTDNGTSFIKIYVDSLAFAPDMAGAGPTDTMDTNDGSVTVVLDNINKAHVAYSLSRTIASTPGSISFFPGTIGLVYWNEITQTKINIPIPLADVDANVSGDYELGDSVTSSTQCRYGSGSVLNKPSIAVDASGNIFIVFSLPQDADISADGLGQSYRDIWVVASQDGGQTWGKVQNITSTLENEEAFACVAKLVDNYLHILYMSDIEPGTALTNGDADNTNEMRYLKVTTAAVLAETVGISNLTSRNELFSVNQNYPNPFSRETTISVNLNRASDLNISVSNLIGQQLMIVTSGNSSGGKHNFVVDASKLSAGIYLYTIKAGSYSVTKKMIIQ